MSPPPLVIGHRGASAVTPENTLAAFARALRDGADGIEFDVRLANDNVPVVIHDATLKRTATFDAEVSTLSSQQLSGIDVGSWFNQKFPLIARPEYEGEKLPTLQSLLDFLSNTAAVLYLEMKCEESEREELALQVVELVRKYSFADRTIVECFDLEAIAAVKRLDSSIRTGALFEPSLRRPQSLLGRLSMIDRAVDYGANEIAMHHTLLNKHVADKAAQLGIPCVVWTVDHPRWVQRAASLGLKALITNNPAAILRTLPK